MTVKKLEFSPAGQGLLTVKEVASYLRCSTCTVYRWVEREEIPCHRINESDIRFKQADVDEWLEKRRAKPLPKLNLPANALTLPPVCRTKVPHGKTGGTSEMAKAKTKSRHNLGYGAIYQRRTEQGISRWYLDYRDATGKRVQKVIPKAQTAEEAILALNSAVSSSLERELGIRKKPNRIGFAEYSGLYLENYAKINKRSWNTDVSYLKSMNSAFGSLYLDEIGPLEIEKYKARRLKEGVTKSTVNRCLAILRKMLTLGVEWDYLEKDAVPKIKFFPEKDNRKERFLTYDEESKLFASAYPTLISVLTIALHTGMRRGEILGLTWSQIDFESKCIRVERTKSGKIRHIEVSTFLRQELSRLKSLDGQSPYVFPNPATGKPLTTVMTAFKGACRRAGIGNDLRFHDLRHTFASRLNYTGSDPKVIMELMGHSSLKMTERYIHTSQEQKRNAVERLAQASLQRDGTRDGSSPSCAVQEAGSTIQ